MNIDTQFLSGYTTGIALPFPHGAVLPNVPAHSFAAETGLSGIRIDLLREAIRRNQITFPSQVPVFPKHDRPDLQVRLAQLYFVRGWSCTKIGARYELSRLRVQQILNTWKRRAILMGYIQEVPPAQEALQFQQGPPITVALSFVVNGARPADPHSMPASPVSSSGGTGRLTPGRSAAPPSYRSRRRFEPEQIVSVLQQFEAGRTVAEIAEESGIRACTIRSWKRQHQKTCLQSENIRLTNELSKLRALQAALIDLIRRSDRPETPVFMPFSRVSNHTERDYRDSL